MEVSIEDIIDSINKFIIFSGDTLELKNNRTIILKKVLVANSIKYSSRKTIRELDDNAFITKLHLQQSVFTFEKLVAALKAGTNISFDVDEEAKTITINSSGGGGGDDKIAKYVRRQYFKNL